MHPSKNHLKPEIVGGHNLTSIRSLFDHNDKNIIVPSARKLFYYNVDSCEQSGEVASPAPDEVIVACERLDIYLYVFTKRGKIYIWNLELLDWINELSLPLSDQEKLVSCKMLSKRQYIYAVFNDETKQTKLYCSMSRSERERPKSREEVGDCSPGGQISFDIGSITPAPVYSNNAESSTEKVSKHRCLTFINGPHVHFQKVGIGEKFSASQFKKRINNPRIFTCVRANSKKFMVAGGDDDGRIWLYYGDFINQNVNRTKLHWHRSLPVNDLCFSSEGNTLFSVGGESGCVVIWDLSLNNIAQRPRVVPRLGMPIRFLSCSNFLNQCILSFEDNEIQIMDTSENTKILKTFTKRTIDMYTRNNYKALRADFVSSRQNLIKSIGLLWHSSTDTVVSNSRTGWLQFYSPKEHSRVQSLNFLGSDVLSLETEARVVPSDITKAAMTLDGDWLAFYETIDSDSSFPFVKLHIWKRLKSTGRWAWIQTADRLHSSTSIIDLKFSPDGQFLVSISEDGTFNVLHRVCLEKAKNASKSKQMYAKGFIGNVPEKLPSMATFSQDSSVMAMSLKNDTTLIWTIIDPFKLVYETQLNQVSPEVESTRDSGDSTISHDVLGLHFGYHNTSQSIAPLCEIRTNSIRIWNILNAQETMEYSASSNTTSENNGLDDDEFTAATFDQCPGDSRSLDHFAVATKKNLVIIFRIQIAQSTRALNPLIIVDANLRSVDSPPSYYTHMCFLSNPILEIDPQCHSDPQLVNLLNRLCLLNNYQELISITDQLTVERKTAINNCNAVKTTDMNDLQAYFAQSVTTYSEETGDIIRKGELDATKITEKQRKIRNRIGVQKMLRDLLTRIPSHNLPQMEILGPMILDKLI